MSITYGGPKPKTDWSKLIGQMVVIECPPFNYHGTLEEVEDKSFTLSSSWMSDQEGDNYYNKEPQKGEQVFARVMVCWSHVDEIFISEELTVFMVKKTYP